MRAAGGGDMPLVGGRCGLRLGAGATLAAKRDGRPWTRGLRACGSSSASDSKSGAGSAHASSGWAAAASPHCGQTCGTLVGCVAPTQPALSRLTIFCGLLAVGVSAGVSAAAAGDGGTVDVVRSRPFTASNRATKAACLSMGPSISHPIPSGGRWEGGCASPPGGIGESVRPSHAHAPRQQPHTLETVRRGHHVLFELSVPLRLLHIGGFGRGSRSDELLSAPRLHRRHVPGCVDRRLLWRGETADRSAGEDLYFGIRGQTNERGSLLPGQAAHRPRQTQRFLAGWFIVPMVEPVHPLLFRSSNSPRGGERIRAALADRDRVRKRDARTAQSQRRLLSRVRRMDPSRTECTAERLLGTKLLRVVVRGRLARDGRCKGGNGPADRRHASRRRGPQQRWWARHRNKLRNHVRAIRLVECMELMLHLGVGFIGTKSRQGLLPANGAAAVGLGAFLKLLLKKRLLALGLRTRQLGRRGAISVAELRAILPAHHRRVPMHGDLTADRARGARCDLGRAMQPNCCLRPRHPGSGSRSLIPVARNLVRFQRSRILDCGCAARGLGPRHPFAAAHERIPARLLGRRLGVHIVQSASLPLLCPLDAVMPGRCTLGGLKSQDFTFGTRSAVCGANIHGCMVQRLSHRGARQLGKAIAGLCPLPRKLFLTVPDRGLEAGASKSCNAPLLLSDLTQACQALVRIDRAARLDGQSHCGFGGDGGGRPATVVPRQRLFIMKTKRTGFLTGAAALHKEYCTKKNTVEVHH
eukprot:scaffold4235_cov114-Isochrysis_galbana.AAC.5